MTSLRLGKPRVTLRLPERCRRRAPQENIAIVQENLAPGTSASAVARRQEVGAKQVFGWRKQDHEGNLTAVKAGETVVPALELAAAIKDSKELQRLWGKKTMENEILREAVEWGWSKSLTARSPLLPEGDQ